MSVLTVEVKTFIQALFKDQNFEIVEAGCAEGTDTLALAKIPTCSYIHAFEPDGRLLEIAQRNCAGLSNVKFYNFALSDKDGEAELFISDRFGEAWGSSSLLSPKDHLSYHTQITFNQKQIVKTVTLDSWLRLSNTSKINALWLDLQGSEPAVLMSSPKILGNVDLIYTELNLVELYQDCILWPEYKAWLLAQGFISVCEELPWKDAGNALLVRTQHTETARQIAKSCFNQSREFIKLQ